MAKKVALLVAVEHYTDSRIPQVNFAEADATQLSAALKLHGFTGKDNVLLVSPRQTKTTIESQLRVLTGGLTVQRGFSLFP